MMPKPTYIEGQTATSRITGKKIVYRAGKWSPVGATTSSPEAKILMTGIDSELLKSRQMAEMGNQFMGYNQSRGTGGILTMLPSAGQPNKQAMEGITSKMLQASILPGQSKSLDSNAEMTAALRRFPNVNTQGPTNRTRNIMLQQDKFLSEQKLNAAKKWIEDGRDPIMFEAEWSQRIPKVRNLFRYEFPPALDASKGEVGNGAMRVNQGALTQPRSSAILNARDMSDEALSNQFADQ